MDLFKEKTTWNLAELKAIHALMTSQAAVDGEVDKNEIELMGQVIVSLPGEKPSDWEGFMDSAINIDAEEHFKVLKKMHTNKKKILVGSLGVLAAIDGNMDDDELNFLIGTAGILGISANPKDW